MGTVRTGYGITLTTDLGGPTLLGGITRQAIRSQTQGSQEAMAGHAYAMHLSLTEQTPMIEFTTRNVSGLLDLVLPPSGILSGGGAIAYQVKKTDGAIDAGSVHRLWTAATGIVVLRRLTCQQGQHAELAAEVLATSSDGATAPIVPSETQALAVDLTDPTRFTLGTLSLGGIYGGLTGKTSVEIDFGVKAEQITCDGHVWPTRVDVSEYLAKITIKSIDTQLVAAAGVPLVGKTFTHANTTGYLRQRDGGGFKTGSDHISFTADGLAYCDNVLDANGNEKAECDFVLMTRFDGTNAPIEFTTGVSL